MTVLLSNQRKAVMLFQLATSERNVRGQSGYGLNGTYLTDCNNIVFTLVLNMGQTIRIVMGGGGRWAKAPHPNKKQELMQGKTPRKNDALTFQTFSQEKTSRRRDSAEKEFLHGKF